MCVRRYAGMDGRIDRPMDVRVQFAVVDVNFFMCKCIQLRLT